VSVLTSGYASTPSPAIPGTRASSPGSSTLYDIILREHSARRGAVEDKLTPFSGPGTQPHVDRANFTAYDCVDPFHSTPVKINAQIHAALQHILRLYVYAGNNYKLAFLPKHVRSTITRFPIGTVVQRSVYQEAHLYSLLAATMARMQHIFAISAYENPEVTRATAAHYLRKELMRSSRSGHVDKQIILDILFLTVNEMQFHHYDSARKHLAVVAKLYHLLDLNDDFDRWISETAAHVDNQVALSTSARPVLPQTFDPGPMLPERMAILKREAQTLPHHRLSAMTGYPSPTVLMVHSGPKGLTDAIADLAATLDLRMGSRFMAGLKLGCFTGSLARIVSDLVDCIEIAKVVWLSPLAVCFDAEWLCRKARAVLRALLAVAPETIFGPKNIATMCMECLRLSLMILLTHACTLIGFETAKANVNRLQQAFSLAFSLWAPSVGRTLDLKPIYHGRLSQFEEAQAGFVLWSLMTAVWASQDSTGQEWFIERACNISHYFEIHSYDDLHAHMSQYLYSKTLQEASLRKVGMRLQDGSHG